MAAMVQEYPTETALLSKRDKSPGPAVGGFTAVNGHPSPSDDARSDSRPNGHRSSRDSSNSPTLVDAQMEEPPRHGDTGSARKGPSPPRANGRFHDPVTASPAKRKRTGSPEDDDEDDDADTDSDLSDDSVLEDAPPKRRMHAFGPPLEGPSPHDARAGARTSTDGSEPRPRSASDVRMSEATTSTGASRGDEHRGSPDVRIVEVVKREEHRPGVSTLPSRSRGGTPPHGSAITTPRSAEIEERLRQPTLINGIHHLERKSRKRQFSHRTKSGCMTCRKRKKKCDEAKPTCANCERGGFQCQGYATRNNTWQKSSPSKAPIHIQSKDGPYQGVIQNVNEPYYDVNGQAPEGARTRPIGIDDEHNPQRRGQWIKSTWDAPSYPVNPPGNEYYRMAPIPHATSRDAMDRAPPTPNSAPLRNGAPPVPSPQVTANLALHHPQPPPRRPSQSYPSQPYAPHPLPQIWTERDKMLNGEEYHPFDNDLVWDRDQCQRLCARFNNNQNFSAHERIHIHLKNILRWPAVQNHPRLQKTGSFGAGVSVDPPFTCLYGYNLDIGDEAVIGAGCTVLDAGDVAIGRACVLGPNVTILANDVPLDPQKRQGRHARNQARRVVIEDEVYIGPHVTIHPGVRIKRGAYVKPGSVVTEDVPQFCIVAGNPAEVKSGICVSA